MLNLRHFQIRRRRRRFTLSALAIAILVCMYFAFILTKQYFTSSTGEIACYRFKQNSLPDILDATPTKGKSIFFHETSCNSYANGKIKMYSRQACAVESAARMNPNFNVYLLFTSPGVIKYEGTASDRMLKALLTYENLKIHHLDYEEYTKNTPVESIYRDRKVESSRYAVSHASDVLRYLTLWKYGGIYLDLDIIVVKSLENLPPNYAGSESEGNVNAAVLSFAPEGMGHRFSQLCVEDLKRNFRGNSWVYNGPGVITRLLQKICGVETAEDTLAKDCQEFTVYPPESFYVVPYWNWTMFFDKKYNNELLNMSKNSYVIHVWNKLSISTKIDVKDDVVPYSMFAKEYCPKVFAECEDYF